jgi:hypothetical protein
MNIEILQKITGYQILKIRRWLDLAVEKDERILKLCPFVSPWNAFKNEEKYVLGTGYTHDEIFDALSLDKVYVTCDVCKNLLMETPKKYTTSHRRTYCPCRRINSIDYIIETVSSLLIKHEDEVNRQMRELKHKLKNIRNGINDNRR